VQARLPGLSLRTGPNYWVAFSDEQDEWWRTAFHVDDHVQPGWSFANNISTDGVRACSDTCLESCVVALMPLWSLSVGHRDTGSCAAEGLAGRACIDSPPAGAGRAAHPAVAAEAAAAAARRARRLRPRQASPPMARPHALCRRRSRPQVPSEGGRGHGRDAAGHQSGPAQPGGASGRRVPERPSAAALRRPGSAPAAAAPADA
jgi:hypothetical protein